MKIRKCGKCGFAAVYSKLIRWRPDGTICIRLNPSFRVLLLEADSLPRIMTNIEQELGVSLRHLFFEAERNVATRVIQSNLIGPAKLVRHLPGGKRFMVKAFCLVAVGTGMGYAEAIGYKAGDYGEAIIRNPFDRELMAAVICGSFECLERQPFGYTWKSVNGDDVIRIEPAEAKPEIAARLDFSLQPIKQGRHEFERCPRCKTPVELGSLEWRENDGLIIDTERNMRMVFLDAYTPNVVIRELARELGDDIYPLVIDAQRSVSLRTLSEGYLASGCNGSAVDKEGLCNSLLGSIAARGQGNPVECSVSGGTWRVTVENPFNGHLLAGHLQAVHQFVEGRKPEVGWEQPDPSTIVYTLS